MMKKFVLLTTLVLCSKFLLSQSCYDIEHIISFSAIDTNVYDIYCPAKSGEKILYENRPSTLGTIFKEFIDKFGENELNRIINLSEDELKSEINAIKNYNASKKLLTKKFLMKKIQFKSDNNDDLKFKHNGDVYVVTYEPMRFKNNLGKQGVSKGNVKTAHKTRKLNLYKWKGNNKWEKINNQPISYIGLPNRTNEYSLHYLPDSYIFKIKSDDYNNFNYDVIGLKVNVKHRKSKRHSYSQLILFIDEPDGFDIRVRRLQRNDIDYSRWYPVEDDFIEIKGKNTFSLKFKNGDYRLNYEHNVLKNKSKCKSNK